MITLKKQTFLRTILGLQKIAMMVQGIPIYPISGVPYY